MGAIPAWSACCIPCQAQFPDISPSCSQTQAGSIRCWTSKPAQNVPSRDDASGRKPLKVQTGSAEAKMKGRHNDYAILSNKDHSSKQNMSLKSGQEKQRGKGPHLNGRSSLGGDSSSNVLKRSVESAINCESSKNGVLGRSCPARPPPSGCCCACIICRPLPLSLDMLIWAHAPGPPPASFKRPTFGIPQSMLAPAGVRRYRFGAPCPRMIGSWLNLASRTRGRFLAVFTCCLSPWQE